MNYSDEPKKGEKMVNTKNILGKKGNKNDRKSKILKKL
jgi:hypothetical protein